MCSRQNVDDEYRSLICLNNYQLNTVLESEGILSDTPYVQIPSAVVRDRLKCLVCDADARGMQFGATACAACGAFFRRTISEQRTYFCKKKQNCYITHGLSKRQLCRFCRLQKCLSMGMKPEKVQNKTGSMESTTMPSVIEMTEMNCVLEEYAIKYSTLQRQRMNRYLAGRSSHAIQYLDEPASMGNYLTIIESEPKLISDFLSSIRAFKGFVDSDKMALIKNYMESSRLIESARIVGLLDQSGSNRMRLLDGSFVEATESACARFFSSGKTETEPPVLMDAAFLTRMEMPIARFHLGTLVPAVLRLGLRDEELAALLNLVLWDAANPELSLQGQQLVLKRRQRAIKELCEYYKSTRMNIQIRFANLLLLLIPLRENTRMWKEALIIMELMKTSKGTYQED